jgi:hypothetical protein
MMWTWPLPVHMLRCCLYMCATANEHERGCVVWQCGSYGGRVLIYSRDKKLARRAPPSPDGTVYIMRPNPFT